MELFGKEINVGGRISQCFIVQGIAMVIVRAFSGKTMLLIFLYAGLAIRSVGLGF